MSFGMETNDGFLKRPSIYMTKSTDEVERSASLSDVMIRRMKNRERQRRYRARKRLETDNKNFYPPNDVFMTEPETRFCGNVEPEVEAFIGKLGQFSKRVLCKRDWKKDARRAHLLKAWNGTNNASSDTSFTANLCNGVAKSESCPENVPGSGNSQMNRTRLNRRDWKAEARNKKN